MIYLCLRALSQSDSRLSDLPLFESSQPMRLQLVPFSQFLYKKQVLRKYNIYHCYTVFVEYKNGKGSSWSSEKVEPNGYQSRVIGHHLAQVEEIPIQWLLR